jgi:tyrosyl-tRNA synthetase
MLNAFDELTWRGLVYDVTRSLPPLLATQSLTIYSGFDPTAPSLHIGHLLPALTLARLQRCGHSPIAVVGGGTGLIGDPSGKSQERGLLSTDVIAENVQAIQSQLSRFLDFERGSHRARIVNNADWLATFDLLGFLRDTGKHFTVNSLLQKESITRRLETADGLSFTEFSYLLLQARDFLELSDRFGCSVQIGGSDQWGNITAGIDLIRRLRGTQAHGLVMPLLTTASGAKFGKTEAGAVWLDAERTKPFRFYQFWLNTDDRDVLRYLKFFTFIEQQDANELELRVQREPEQRAAQRVLAREVTTLVHGKNQSERAEHASGLLFSEDIAKLPVEDVLAVFEDVPSTQMRRDALEGGMSLVELVAQTHLAASKSDARRLIQSGGVYLNNRRVTDPQMKLMQSDAVDGQLFVVRKGQKQNHLVRVV